MQGLTLVSQVEESSSTFEIETPSGFEIESPTETTPPPPPTKRHTILLAYAMLALGNLMFAAVGPTFLIIARQAKVGLMVTAAWRNHIMIFLVGPCALFEWWSTPRSTRQKWFTPTTLVQHTNY